MLIYLDTRDLIELLSPNTSIPSQDFGQLLTDTRSCVIFSFENISELVVVPDPPETRSRLRQLETLPHQFMLAIPKLRCLELTNAIRAFDPKQKVAPLDPFVAHWESTFGYPHERLLGYTLTDVVMELLHKQPGQFQKTKSEQRVLIGAVAKDRAATDAERRSRARFRGAILTGLRKCHLVSSVTDPREFAEWAYDNPAEYPGMSFFNRMYLEYASNSRDVVQSGDHFDFSHAARIPYVDALTLDRRMRGYANQTIRQLQRFPGCDYSGRVFDDLSAVVNALRSDKT